MYAIAKEQNHITVLECTAEGNTITTVMELSQKTCCFTNINKLPLFYTLCHKDTGGTNV